MITAVLKILTVRRNLTFFAYKKFVNKDSSTEIGNLKYQLRYSLHNSIIKPHISLHSTLWDHKLNFFKTS